ncbi:MAG: hypothetical protein IJ544_04985 [Prevotella sp.]|nr:hypothetical protein [Prevotella sp.]
MKNVFLSLTLCCLLAACGQLTDGESASPLEGTWLLRYVEYPTGEAYDYSIEGKGTYCLLYDSDSMLYESIISMTPSGFVIMPTAKRVVTLIDKGGGERLYLEDGDPHPLTISSDTAITIQRKGALYSLVRDDDLYLEWGTEIREIIIRDLGSENSMARNYYVLSAKERQQERDLQWHGYVFMLIIVISFFIAQYIVSKRRAMRRLQLQLQQIREVKENRPQAVRQIVASVENDFFASDDYAALQRRIASGRVMKDVDWQTVEQHLKSICPGFTTQLRNLRPMSELEYQVCLLIKLRIAPKDIAAVLSRDVSTISTVRSRLYKKVFGRKGGAREWDDFILSIG